MKTSSFKCVFNRNSIYLKFIWEMNETIIW